MSFKKKLILWFFILITFPKNIFAMDKATKNILSLWLKGDGFQLQSINYSSKGKSKNIFIKADNKCFYFINLSQKLFHFQCGENEDIPSFDKFISLVPGEKVLYRAKLTYLPKASIQKNFKYALQTKKWSEALKYLKLGADPLVYINTFQHLGNTPLNIALDGFKDFWKRREVLPFLEELLKNPKVLSFKDGQGKTALQMAKEKKETNKVNFLKAQSK